MLLICLGVLPWLAAEWLQRGRQVLRPETPAGPAPRPPRPTFDVDGWVHEQRHVVAG